MLSGDRCRYLSATEDQQIMKNRGGGVTLAEVVDDYRFDAATPEQLDALAFQLLCYQRRVNHRDDKRFWKKQREDGHGRRRGRARAPRRASEPGQPPRFFSSRSVGKPGHLDCDLFLPLAFRLDLSGLPVAEVYTGCYSPTLREGVVYRPQASRLGETWLAHELPTAIKVRNNTLRGLLTMGRMVAAPLSASLPKAA